MKGREGQERVEEEREERETYLVAVLQGRANSASGVTLRALDAALLAATLGGSGSADRSGVAEAWRNVKEPSVTFGEGAEERKRSVPEAHMPLLLQPKPLETPAVAGAAQIMLVVSHDSAK